MKGRRRPLGRRAVAGDRRNSRAVSSKSGLHFPEAVSVRGAGGAPRYESLESAPSSRVS